MEKTENKYRYADKTQQIKRVNRFLTVGYIVFYLFVLGVVGVACIRGIRTVGYTALLAAVILLSILITVILYKRRVTDTKIRYIATVGLLIVTFFMSYAFDNYYVRFMAAIPVTVGVIFYDRVFAAVSGIAFGAMNILMNVIKIAVLGMYEGEAALDQICATVAICLLFVLVYLMTCVAKQFNDDTIGSLEEKEQAQEKMLRDVLAVAEEVRKGTENAMGIVTDLNDSTGVVNGTMRDISDSTQNTAENIQTQTAMTQNIQDSIGRTLERSEKMVRVAKESGELNRQSAGIMEELKQQSKVIAATNSEVADSMKRLQEKTNAVKSIADTIFSISSQTNLLALNASIEAARAGEAGKGFAVVADEIRQLSEQTKDATNRITDIIRDLNMDAEQAMQNMENSARSIQEQNELIETTKDKFEMIDGEMQTLAEVIARIEDVMKSILTSTDMISESISNLSAASQEVAASSAEGLQTANGAVETMQKTKEIIEATYTLAQDLKTYAE